MTPEHAQARCGQTTSSEFKSVLAKGEGKTRSAYLRRVVAEMLTGKPVEINVGRARAHLDRGNEQEPFGRMAYEAATGNLVEQVEFIPHPTIAAGCSPDGLIDDDGGLELKSVIPTVQVDTILGGGYPSEHRAQVQGNLWITNRQWWDFASYSPDMPGKLKLYIFRVRRDEDYIRKLEAEVTAFVREAQELRDRLLRGDDLEGALRASLAKVAA